MQNNQWTEEMVIKAFEEAVRTIQRLPNVKLRGYASIWPDVIYSTLEVLRMDVKPTKWPATPEQISSMERTCDWINFLDDIDDKRLVWLRAKRIPWKPICCQLGISRITGNRKYKNAIRKITQKLL